MKKVFYSLFIMLLNIILIGCAKKTTIEAGHFNLEGSVKKHIAGEYRIQFYDTKTNLVPLSEEIRIYNKHRSNTQTDIKEFSPEGTIISRRRAYTTYDNQKRILSMDIYNTAGVIAEKGLYIYGAQGKVIKKLIKDAFNTLQKTFIYKYDEKGNQTLIQIQNRFGGIEMSVSNIYDSKARLIEKRDLDFSGDIVMITKYSYNALGKVSSEKILNANGKVQGKSEWRYNVYGDKTEWLRVNSEGMIQWKWVYKYIDGKVVECVTLNSSSDPIEKVTYLYDDKRNITNETIFRPLFVSNRIVDFVQDRVIQCKIEYFN